MLRHLLSWAGLELYEGAMMGFFIAWIYMGVLGALLIDADLRRGFHSLTGWQWVCAIAVGPVSLAAGLMTFVIE